MTDIRKLRVLDGSNAMNPDPDYCAAYCILETNGPSLEGHGLTFTIGRGNDVVCAAIEALAPLVEGLDLDWIREDGARFLRHVTADSQLRWIGPEKGVIHLATGAVVNAVWDLLAKEAGKPLWQLIGEMSPAKLIGLIDFRYITDCITPEEGLALLEERAPGKAERVATLLDKVTQHTPPRRDGSAIRMPSSNDCAARLWRKDSIM